MTLLTLVPSSREHALETEIIYLKEQIKFLFEELHKRDLIIRELREECARKDARISELERRLKLDSTNSSKPPSSDFLTKPEPSKSQKKRGPKGGHPGITRKDYGEPDRVVDLSPETCNHCGLSLEGVDVLPGHRHQVAEWVAKPIEIVEYHHQVKLCPHCHHKSEAPYPIDIIPGSRLGPRLIAHLLLFNRWGHLSIDKLTDLCQEFSLPISGGTLNNKLFLAYEALKSPYLTLAKSLRNAPQLNVDETSWRIEGERFNVWTFSSSSFSFLKIAKSRGSIVLKETLGEEYPGLIICDFFGAYDRYLTQRCLAHLRRDLKGCAESRDLACKAFALEALAHIKEAWDLWRNHKDSGSALSTYRERGQEIKDQFREYLAKLPDDLSAPAVTLRKRIWDDWDELWPFLSDPNVPPHNNDAERSLRPIVTLRKMSGGSRSDWGAELCAMVHTIIATCRKQGKNPYSFIVEALLAKAQPGKVSIPSLV